MLASVSQLPQVRSRRGPLQHDHSNRRFVARFCASSEPVVVGVGGVGIDYLASVLTFPKPDQKLRTERLEAQGGGNCGNCLTAAARLGLSCRVVSTVGTDTLGDSVVAEFEADGVSTQFLSRQEGAATPFTYIIVDEAGDVHRVFHARMENSLSLIVCHMASRTRWGKSCSIMVLAQARPLRT